MRFSIQNKSILLLLFLIWGTSLGLRGQSCGQQIKEAEDALKKGLFQDVPVLLEDCSQRGDLPRTERVRIQRLLTLAWLYLDEEEKAEASFLKVLRLEPEHKVDTLSDPAELIKLYQRFRTRPVLRVGLRPGFNFSWPMPFGQTYGVDNTLSDRPTYTSETTFEAGAIFDIPFNRRIGLALEVIYANRAYNYRNQLVTGNTAFSELTFTENQTWLQLPVLFRYEFDFRRYTFQEQRFVPYLYAGLGVNYLLEARFEEITRSGLDPQATDLAGGANSAVGVTDLRNRLNLTAIGGLGLRYKAGRGYFIGTVRFNVALFNLINPDRRYDSDELIYTYGYVDQNFRMSTLTLGFGYVLNIYNPRLIEK